MSEGYFRCKSKCCFHFYASFHFHIYSISIHILILPHACIILYVEIEYRIEGCMFACVDEWKESFLHTCTRQTNHRTHTCVQVTRKQHLHKQRALKRRRIRAWHILFCSALISSLRTCPLPIQHSTHTHQPLHTQANVSFDYTPKNRWMGTSFALITRIVVFNIFIYAYFLLLYFLTPYLFVWVLVLCHETSFSSEIFMFLMTVWILLLFHLSIFICRLFNIRCYSFLSPNLHSSPLTNDVKCMSLF